MRPPRPLPRLDDGRAPDEAKIQQDRADKVRASPSASAPRSSSWPMARTACSATRTRRRRRRDGRRRRGRGARGAADAAPGERDRHDRRTASRRSPRSRSTTTRHASRRVAVRRRLRRLAGRRPGQRLPDPPPGPALGRDRARDRHLGRLSGRAGAGGAREAARARGAQGRRGRLLAADQGGFRRRARAARRGRSTTCRTSSRGWTARASSSSPPRRTSCARRSSPWAGSWSCWPTRTSTRRRGARSWSRSAARSTACATWRSSCSTSRGWRRARWSCGSSRPTSASSRARSRRSSRPPPRSTSPTWSWTCSREPIELDCDPERVAQVLRILLDNALAPHAARDGRSCFSRAGEWARSPRGRRPRPRDQPPEHAAHLRAVLHLQRAGPGRRARPRDRARAGGAHAGSPDRPLRSRRDDVLAGPAGMRRLLAVAGAGVARSRRVRRQGRAAPADGQCDRRRTRGRSRRRARPRAASTPSRSTSTRRRASSRSPSLFGSEGGEGSGFVLNGEGEIVTNAHVVTDRRGQAIEARRTRSTSSSPTATASRREVLGHDPNADIALLKVDPKGLTLDPLPLGDSEAVRVGEPVAAIGSPFGQAQSLSVGHRLRGRPRRRVADRLRDLGRDPDRRGDQPGQLRRAAGRRRRPRDRHQPADPVALRRRRGRRVRGADRRRQALGRPAARGRHGRVRLSRRVLGAAVSAARRPLRPEGRARACGSRRSTAGGPAAARRVRGGSGREAFQGARVRARRRRHHQGRRTRRSRTPTTSRSRVARFKPGETVAVEIYRDGERQTLTSSSASARPATGPWPRVECPPDIVQRDERAAATGPGLQPWPGHLPGGRLGQARHGRARDRPDRPRLPPRRDLDRVGDDRPGRRGRPRARRQAVRGRGARGRLLPRALRRVRRRGLRPLLQHHRQPDALVHPALPLGPEQRAGHPPARGGRLRAGLPGRQPRPRRGRHRRDRGPATSPS